MRNLHKMRNNEIVARPSLTLLFADGFSTLNGMLPKPSEQAPRTRNRATDTQTPKQGYVVNEKDFPIVENELTRTLDKYGHRLIETTDPKELADIQKKIVDAFYA